MLDEPVQIVDIGSTSIPGLAAKPIIDFLVGLEQWPMIEAVVKHRDRL